MPKLKTDEADGKRRGRPRAYDREAALLKAMEVFWTAGYSATSLDDITAATGMNRPSIYAAFGDKRGLYLQALDYYWQAGLDAMREALAPGVPVREGLMRVYRAALSIYFPAKQQARGCFGIGTATVETMAHPEIRAKFTEGLEKFDAEFETRLKLAKEQDEIASPADAHALAMIASATLHTLAIRSRGGASKASLEKLAQSAVDVICGVQARD